MSRTKLPAEDDNLSPAVINALELRKRWVSARTATVGEVAHREYAAAVKALSAADSDQFALALAASRNQTLRKRTV